jgi:hypothetical protein
MKSFILVILSLLIFSGHSLSQAGKIGLTKTDSLLIEKIRKEDPRKYIGKLLNDFLSNKIFKKYKTWILSDEPPGKLYAIFLSYSKQVWIDIIFDGIHYQKGFNKERKWDFNLLKKEKIYEIRYSWEE